MRALLGVTARESDAANVTFPVALPLLFAYALSFGIVFGGSSNGLFDVLAYIPPTAPIASTTLYEALRSEA